MQHLKSELVTSLSLEYVAEGKTELSYAMNRYWQSVFFLDSCWCCDGAVLLVVAASQSVPEASCVSYGALRQIFNTFAGYVVIPEIPPWPFVDVSISCEWNAIAGSLHLNHH